MNPRHEATLAAVFDDPIRVSIRWADIEAMLAAPGDLGAEITEGRGSRVRVHLRGVRAVFHRPHPRKEAGRGAVKSVRRFLAEAGIGSKGE